MGSLRVKMLLATLKNSFPNFSIDKACFRSKMCIKLHCPFKERIFIIIPVIYQFTCSVPMNQYTIIHRIKVKFGLLQVILFFWHLLNFIVGSCEELSHEICINLLVSQCLFIWIDVYFTIKVGRTTCLTWIIRYLTLNKCYFVIIIYS